MPVVHHIATGRSHRKHAAAVNLALKTKLASKRLVGWGRSARLRLGNITELLRADDGTYCVQTECLPT